MAAVTRARPSRFETRSSPSASGSPTPSTRSAPRSRRQPTSDPRCGGTSRGRCGRRRSRVLAGRRNRRDDEVVCTPGPRGKRSPLRPLLLRRPRLIASRLRTRSPGRHSRRRGENAGLVKPARRSVQWLRRPEASFHALGVGSQTKRYVRPFRKVTVQVVEPRKRWSCACSRRPGQMVVHRRTVADDDAAAGRARHARATGAKRDRRSRTDGRRQVGGLVVGGGGGVGGPPPVVNEPRITVLCGSQTNV